MFGVQQHVLDQMYGGADGIPTIGEPIFWFNQMPYSWPATLYMVDLEQGWWRTQLGEIESLSSASWIWSSFPPITILALILVLLFLSSPSLPSSYTFVVILIFFLIPIFVLIIILIFVLILICRLLSLWSSFCGQTTHQPNRRKRKKTNDRSESSFFLSNIPKQGCYQQPATC